MAETEQTRGGFIAHIQARPQWQRGLIFFGLAALAVVILFALTAFMMLQSWEATPRLIPQVVEEQALSLSEYALFDEVDTYPAALALGADGTLYTGSYVTGAIWSIEPDGTIRELPQTRERIGSIAGLDVDRDGVLYVLDRIDPLQAKGAIIWRLADGDLERVGTLPIESQGQALLPSDIAVDPDGLLYVTESRLDTVWRFEEGSDRRVWWRSPQGDTLNEAALSGLAIHPANNTLLVGDSTRNIIYSVPLDSDDPQAESIILYQHDKAGEYPGLKGLSVASDGTIYVATLGSNQVMRLDAESKSLTLLAESFRGSSDVAYDALNERLFVSNWDQRWLLPVPFLFLQFQISPRLPFSIDLLEFS